MLKSNKNSTIKKPTFKEWVLFVTVILSQLHTLFRGDKTRVDWFLLIEHTRRIDYAVLYLTTSINFLIISYCLCFPKGVRQQTKDFIFIVCILDFLHYILLSKLYLGFSKIGIAIFIYYITQYIRKKW